MLNELIMLSKKEIAQFERYVIIAALFQLCDPLRTMDEQQQFKTGDIVQLKSGGPAMTVGNRLSDGRLECAFFDGKTLKHVSLPPAQLKRAETPEEPHSSSQMTY